MHIQKILMFVCTLKSAELHDVNCLNELMKLAQWKPYIRDFHWNGWLTNLVWYDMSIQSLSICYNII